MELVELQNGLETKGETQSNEAENKLSEEDKKADVVEVKDIRDVEEVNEETETERKSFASDKERLVEIAVETKLADNEESESLKGEEVVENNDEMKRVNVEDKESLLQNDVEDSEGHKSLVTTV